MDSASLPSHINVGLDPSEARNSTRGSQSQDTLLCWLMKVDKRKCGEKKSVCALLPARSSTIMDIVIRS